MPAKKKRQEEGESSPRKPDPCECAIGEVPLLPEQAETMPFLNLACYYSPLISAAFRSCAILWVSHGSHGAHGRSPVTPQIPRSTDPAAFFATCRTISDQRYPASISTARRYDRRQREIDTKRSTLVLLNQLKSYLVGARPTCTISQCVFGQDERRGCIRHTAYGPVSGPPRSRPQSAIPCHPPCSFRQLSIQDGTRNARNGYLKCKGPCPRH